MLVFVCVCVSQYGIDVFLDSLLLTLARGVFCKHVRLSFAAGRWHLRRRRLEQQVSHPPLFVLRLFLRVKFLLCGVFCRCACLCVVCHARIAAVSAHTAPTRRLQTKHCRAAQARSAHEIAETCLGSNVGSTPVRINIDAYCSRSYSILHSESSYPLWRPPGLGFPRRRAFALRAWPAYKSRPALAQRPTRPSLPRPSARSDCPQEVPLSASGAASDPWMTCRMCYGGAHARSPFSSRWAACGSPSLSRGAAAAAAAAPRPRTLSSFAGD